MKSSPDNIQVIHADIACPELPLIEGKGSVRAVIWPGTGAKHRTMHQIVLGSGSTTKLLGHPMEAAYYVISGSGSVEDNFGGSQSLTEGSMIHINDGSLYRICAGAQGMVVIGGPCPADLNWYQHLSRGE